MSSSCFSKQFLYVIFSTSSFVAFMNSFFVYKNSFVIYRLILCCLQNVLPIPDHGVFRMHGLVSIFSYIYITDSIIFLIEKIILKTLKKAILSFIGRMILLWITTVYLRFNYNSYTVSFKFSQRYKKFSIIFS